MRFCTIYSPSIFVLFRRATLNLFASVRCRVCNTPWKLREYILAGDAVREYMRTQTYLHNCVIFQTNGPQSEYLNTSRFSFRTTNTIRNLPSSPLYPQRKSGIAETFPFNIAQFCSFSEPALWIKHSKQFTSLLIYLFCCYFIGIWVTFSSILFSSSYLYFDFFNKNITEIIHYFWHQWK